MSGRVVYTKSSQDITQVDSPLLAKQGVQLACTWSLGAVACNIPA